MHFLPTIEPRTPRVPRRRDGRRLRLRGHPPRDEESGGRACATRRCRSRSAAAWRSGRAAAPKTEHDVDFFVKPEDAERAQQALVAAGLTPETPPEGWLLKAWDGDVLVDLIFEPRGGPIDDELARARRGARRLRGDDARRVARRRARDEAARADRAEPRLLERARDRARACASRSTGTRSGAAATGSPYANGVPRARRGARRRAGGCVARS